MSSRSYTPRHSSAPPRPERTNARIGTAIVTTLGATAVATTALAGPAEAATHHTVWDRVAGCESGHRWHVNTGNGYYGGVQFSSGTWSAYGGHKYAYQANKASRKEQIEVARRVLAKQGAGAWPVCGPRSGLSRHSGHATSAALPHVASGYNTAHSSTAHKSYAKSHHKKSHHSTSHKKSHHSTSHHTKSHHKSRSHAYHVHSGDTLSGIAAKFHVNGGWHALYRANRHHMSSPNVLHVGQYLRIP